MLERRERRALAMFCAGEWRRGEVEGMNICLKRKGTFTYANVTIQ